MDDNLGGSKTALDDLFAKLDRLEEEGTGRKRGSINFFLAQVEDLDLTDMNNIQVVRYHIEKTKEEIEKAVERVVPDLTRKVQNLQKEQNNLTNENEYLEKEIDEIERELKTKRMKYVDDQEKRLKNARARHNKLKQISEKSKNEQVQRATRLHKLQQILNSIPENKKKLSFEELMLMKERWEEIKKKEERRPDMNKLNEKLQEWKDKLEKKKQEVKDYNHEYASYVKKCQYIRDDIEKCKWEIMELGERAQFNGTEINRKASLDELVRLKNDERTLQIFFTKMRSEIEDYEVQHGHSMDYYKICKQNMEEFDKELGEILDQLKTAKEDRELTLMLERSREESEKARTQKQEWFREAMNEMEGLSVEISELKSRTRKAKEKILIDDAEIRELKEITTENFAKTKENEAIIEDTRNKITVANTMLQKHQNEFNKYNDECIKISQEIKETTKKSNEAQTLIKVLKKKAGNLVKLQDKENKLKENLKKVKEIHEEDNEFLDQAIYDYCIFMLPPERVKYPRSAEIFRKNDKEFEKKIDTLVQNYKEYLSEYLKEKEQRLEVHKEYLAEPSVQISAQASEKQLETEDEHLKTYCNTALQFWNAAEMTTEAKQLDDFLLQCQDQFAEKQKIHPNVMKHFPQNDQEILPAIENLNEKNIELFKNIREIIF